MRSGSNDPWKSMSWKVLETVLSHLKAIQDVWNLRDKHMVKGLRSKYVFHLVCCYWEDCIHPECQGEPPEELPVWYPGGPPVTFLPMLVPDIGTYVQVFAKYNRIPCIQMDKALKGEQLQCVPPPSEVLKKCSVKVTTRTKWIKPP